MSALSSQFGVSLTLSMIALVVAVVVAVARGTQAAKEGQSWWGPVVRALAIGAAVVIFVATALPQVWPPRLSGDGDLVLELGRGGLAEWRSVIEAPTSWASILILANIAVYVPFGFLGALAWPDRGARVLAAGLGISLLVELSHFTISERVASIDDVLLNGTGLLIGWLGGVAVAGLIPPRFANDKPGSRLNGPG